MRRLVLALVVSLGLSAATSLGAAGDLGGTQVPLLDRAATDPATATARWTVYDYNPSGRAIAPRNSPYSMPATTTGDTTSFPFIAGTFTALLTTTDRALTGDLSSTTLSDTVSWSGTGGFSDQNNGGCTPELQKVRFYIASPSASGPSVGTPPAGFYTQFWWSDDPQSVQLLGDTGGGTMSATLQVPVAPGEWSDWNGKPASDPAVTEAFIEATQHVNTVGLSFGGGCFFENGVTTVNGGIFTSTFGETP